MIKKIIISEHGIGERIDQFLAKDFSSYSRNYFISLIKEEKILVNNKPIKSSYKLKENDLIQVELIEKDLNPQLQPENIKLNIIYEDNNVIVVNKPAGLVVHPAAGNLSGTLVNALINYFPQIQNAVYEKGNPVSESRPGLVHRLDKDTSGVIIIAKNSRAMHSLSRQIQNRTVKKVYLAICYGWPKNESGHLTNYLGRHPKNRKHMAEVGPEKGKEAISDYKVLQYLQTKDNSKISLIEFDIKTGRTHQIRVQASHLGYPVLGDDFYYNKESQKLSQKLNISRQLLHARSLQITLPGDHTPSYFVAEIPTDFQRIVESYTK